MVFDRFIEKFLYSVVLLCLLSSACSQTKKLNSSSIVTEPDETTIEGQTELPEKQPEMPPPDVGERDFFKIQVLATQSFDRACEEKNRLREYTDETIYLVNEKDLWKVQIGDFASREETEKERNLLQRIGWIDAWIIQYRASTKPIDTQTKTTPATELSLSTFYTVQLIATTSKTDAENMHRNLLMLNITDAVLIKEGDFWKIQVGRFSEYENAAKMLNRVREMGFNDSWITKRSNRLPENNHNFYNSSLY